MCIQEGVTQDNNWVLLSAVGMTQIFDKGLCWVMPTVKI